MGDSTPEAKSSGNLTSKYLTPCRTFGLKRRNTPRSDVLKKIRSEYDSSILKPKTIEDSSAKGKVNISRTCLRHLTSDCSETDRQKLPDKSLNNLSPLLKNDKQKLQPSLNSNDPQTLLNSLPSKKDQICQSSSLKLVGFQSKKNLLECEVTSQIKRVNEKINRLGKLKQEEIYTRKHNLRELQKSTDKWLATFKEVAFVLQTELQARGRTCTILDVLEEHNIPPERVSFNVESLEFD